MKLLFLAILFIAGCSSGTEGAYKKKYHLEDIKSSIGPKELHQILADKMKQCYPQSEYPAYKKTLSSFDPLLENGVIYYEVDNQGMGVKKLVFVEVIKDEAGSLVKIYSKGDMFRPATVYKHHIQKWIDGKKADCDSRGKI